MTRFRRRQRHAFKLVPRKTGNVEHIEPVEDDRRRCSIAMELQQRRVRRNEQPLRASAATRGRVADRPCRGARLRRRHQLDARTTIRSIRRFPTTLFRGSTRSTHGDRLIDGFSRPITYLRISVTDKCNLRCVYCMPESGLPWLRRDEILSYEEIVEIVRAAATVGVRSRSSDRRRAAAPAGV